MNSSKLLVKPGHIGFNIYYDGLNSLNYTSVQFSSVAQSSMTLCDPMNRSTPGLPVHHQLPEFTQTHVQVYLFPIQNIKIQGPRTLINS